VEETGDVNAVQYSYLCRWYCWQLRTLCSLLVERCTVVVWRTVCCMSMKHATTSSRA